RRYELYQTPCRVAPKERALRPAQDLDALDVKHLPRKAVLVAQINIIDVDRDRAFVDPRSRAVSANPSDTEVGSGIRAALIGDVEVRRLPRDRREGRKIEIFNLLAAHHADRDRNIDRRLLAPLRGHDDLATFLRRTRAAFLRQCCAAAPKG